ncbi:MAG: diguanylate cyclase [Pseudobdellovibrionaceae bacterium]|jgi:diguanylate cyclase (GGDEF)-like protein|nr:diguanylate cyclase [Pseudomonadota bacterium]
MSIKPAERRVLVVDDDQDSLDIIAEALRWEGYVVETAISGKLAIEAIKSWDPDLILLDVNMPGLSGLDTLKDLRQKEKYVSVMFISGNTSTEAVVAGLDTGADDYIPKPFDPLELLARVRTQLRIKDLNDQLRAANEKLKELVDIDDLTGLYNMRSVYERIETELTRARRFGRQVCIVMMDMDHFKTVNDGHDHLFGSFVISEVGKIIRQSIRSIDMGARYGGDEFLMMLTETSAEGARHFCERLRQTIQSYHFKNDRDEIRLTSSIGFAITAPGDRETDARGLVRAADHALFDAKRAGKNCVKFVEINAASEFHQEQPVPLRKKVVG